MSPRQRQVKVGAAASQQETARDRVYRISTELFARNGYHATGVQEISEAVGLGRGALYYYIKGKEDLLYQISMSLLQPMIDRAAAIANSGDSPREQLRALARDLLRNLAEHRAGWTVSLYESRALPPERQADVIAGRSEFERVWADVLNRGYRDGSFRQVTPLMRRGILGFFNSSYLWIEPDGPLSPEEIADGYVELLVEGLRTR
jgi:AcrR family transcriptional regulator